MVSLRLLQYSVPTTCFNWKSCFFLYCTLNKIFSYYLRHNVDVAYCVTRLDGSVRMIIIFVKKKIMLYRIMCIYVEQCCLRVGPRLNCSLFMRRLPLWRYETIDKQKTEQKNACNININDDEAINIVKRKLKNREDLKTPGIYCAHYAEPRDPRLRFTNTSEAARVVNIKKKKKTGCSRPSQVTATGRGREKRPRAVTYGVARATTGVGSGTRYCLNVTRGVRSSA